MVTVISQNIATVTSQGGGWRSCSGDSCSHSDRALRVADLMVWEYAALRGTIVVQVQALPQQRVCLKGEAPAFPWQL